ncbi:thermospermine synthase ACAULIS5-like [Solanum pennellii]|uniref:thermospermine synthase n=1 Tax=Solanum pennellii TaxID=28526 RepID=A0ABM1H8G3_SOLPN|nr:thermospermine synthase ACAULIS5-like [Solanum pennellii]
MEQTIENEIADSNAKNVEWFEESLGVDLKWSLAINSVLYKATTKFQDVTLLDTKHFGKVLVIDGKMQSAEKDEFIYHESLIHPALLLHDNPRRVFIMGGGEGSAAREALKHDNILKVVISDIDQELVNICRKHLVANQEAFADSRLHVIINDAKVELEKSDEYNKYDVIVGDLSDPKEGGPCNHLYLKSFYQHIIKPKLNHNGIFVTQAGFAGVLSHQDFFSSVYNTAKQVFNHVIAYTAHVPSLADTRGWVLASDQPLKLDAEVINNRIKERIRGSELQFIDAAFMLAFTIMNKTLHTTLMNETNVLTEENDKSLHGN